MFLRIRNYAGQGYKHAFAPGQAVAYINTHLIRSVTVEGDYMHIYDVGVGKYSFRYSTYQVARKSADDVLEHIRKSHHRLYIMRDSEIHDVKTENELF